MRSESKVLISRRPQGRAQQVVLAVEGVQRQLVAEARLGGDRRLGVEVDVVAVGPGRVRGLPDGAVTDRRGPAVGELAAQGGLEVDAAGQVAGRVDVGDVVGGDLLALLQPGEGGVQRRHGHVGDHRALVGERRSTGTSGNDGTHPQGGPEGGVRRSVAGWCAPCSSVLGSPVNEREHVRQVRRTWSRGVAVVGYAFGACSAARICFCSSTVSTAARAPASMVLFSWARASQVYDSTQISGSWARAFLISASRARPMKPPRPVWIAGARLTVPSVDEVAVMRTAMSNSLISSMGVVTAARSCRARSMTRGTCATRALPGHTLPAALLHRTPPATSHGSMPCRW